MTKPNSSANLAKLLRAIAGGSRAKESGHDVIFNAAADTLEKINAIPPDSTSYPYLALARERGLDYGDVLDAADYCTRIRENSNGCWYRSKLSDADHRAVMQIAQQVHDRHGVWL